ncbi:hypothetical protein BDR05DRAFT_104385 [Suillus weaverae]|nr:hypothetical protein BDR05DRAFT_104385 [Suillus weaverae]
MLKLKAKMRFLEREQTAVTAWWRLIASYRVNIQKKRLELNKARSEASIDAKKIARLEDEMKQLRGRGEGPSISLFSSQHLASSFLSFHPTHTQLAPALFIMSPGANHKCRFNVRFHVD